MIAAAIVDRIEKETGSRIQPASGRRVSGGCIHDSALFQTDQGNSLFVKQNRADALPVFEAEFHGLGWLASSNSVKVPKPFCFGEENGTSFLAMEALSLRDRRDAESSQKMGQQLARLHEFRGERYGADCDNFIGATPQPNDWRDNWADFFTELRLGHQFQLAARRGHTFSKEKEVLRVVHRHLSELEVEAVLLHGDLWGGNASFDERGEPVLFDPASYYGDREADIAFTKVFGGFRAEFYKTYRQFHEEPEPLRSIIYNLYHILNHYVLFGGGYARQAEGMIEEILHSA